VYTHVHPIIQINAKLKISKISVLKLPDHS